MAKVEITSSGKIAGYNTKVVIDGQDVSQHCDNLTIEMPVGERIKVNVSIVVRDLDINLDDADVEYTQSEVSKEIREWLSRKAANGN